MAVASLGADSVCANPSRRHILSALAVAPIVTFPVFAAANGSISSGDTDMNMMTALPLPQADAEFWALHAQCVEIDKEWDAALRAAAGDEDKEEEAFIYYGALEDEVRQKMFLAEITTLPALMAKMEMTNSAPDTITGDEDYCTVWACLMRDVKGMAASSADAARPLPHQRKGS